jgi:hypothetical protein
VVAQKARAVVVSWTHEGDEMFCAVKSKMVSAAIALTLGVALSACSEMLSREDFAARVKDKSDVEVKQAIGKPAAVDEKPDQVTWTYNSRTFNIEEGNKFDSKTVVVFSKAGTEGKLRAVDVKFE